MRWLKSLVIVLGLLIVGGVFLLGFGFYKKTADPGWKLFGAEQLAAVENPLPTPQTAPQKRRQPDSIKPFGTLSLNLPLGCVISKVTPKRRYVFLEIGPTADCNQVIVVDLQGGVVLGALKPRP